MRVAKFIGLFASVAPLALASMPAVAQSAAAAPDTGAATVQVQGSAEAAAPQSDAAASIVVTGVRRSLKNSIDAKRNSDLIQDSISSEDVGKFPTLNIADALQRITGVQVQRNWGEGSTILLRGLPSTMVTNMYDGRQLPSPTGSRSLDYSILPVDFVQTLSIYKSPTADLPEAGLAGTVNVEPIKPLDLKKRTIALNVDGVYDSNTKKVKPGFSAFYADQFFGGTLGVAIGVSVTKREISRAGWNDFLFEPRSEIPPGGSAVPGGNNFYPNGFDPDQDGAYNDVYRLWHYAQLAENFGTRDRRSAVINVQWRPDPSFELHGDLIASRMRTDALTASASSRFTNALGAFHNVQTDANNNIISADVDNAWLLYTARDDDNRQRLTTGSLGMNWTPSDRLQLDAGGSAGTARATDSNFSLEGTAYTKMHYDFTHDPQVVSWNYADPSFNPNNPNNFYFDHINGNWDQTSNNDTHEGHVNLKFKSDWGVLKSIDVGGNLVSNKFYGDGSFVYVTNLAALSNLTGLPIIANAYPDGRSALSAASFMSSSPFSGNVVSSYSGGAQFPQSFLWTDPRKFFSQYSIAQLAAIPGSLSRNPAEDARVNELVKAAYARINFSGDGGRWSGNIGIRYERTDEASRFFGVDFSKIVYDPSPACDQICAQANQTLNPTILKNVTNNYGNWLPSLNTKYSITTDLIARISASKEMTRADLSVLEGGESVQMLQTPATGGNPITTISSGNPNIKPYLANAFDASLEWYFSREGLLSAAFFYKDVSNWVFTSTTDEVHTIALKQGGTQDYTFVRTLPQNGAGVKIKGLELSYQQPFTFLPGALSGLGFVGNYTYVDVGDVTDKSTGQRQPVTGVSRNSFNASLYYEKYGFDARISYNYHQGRIEEVRDYWNVTPVYSKNYGQFDLSAGYQINNRAQVTASVINLLNKADYIDYAKIGGYINDWNQEGRIIQLGLHVKI